jgi:hypothetical protein
MNQWIMDPANGDNSRNSRLGMGLALVAVLYVAAVILFIVIY